MHRVRFLGIFSSLLLSIILLLTMFGGACAKPVVQEKPTIKLVEFDWTSQIFLVEILDKIISEQLGYPTKRTHLSQPVTWPAMDRGDVDITTEIWFPVRQPEIQPYLDKGNIELAGVVFTGISLAWAVPTYVIKGDSTRGIKPMAPDLKTILDLKKYWKLFESPEKPGLGELVGGPPGWLDPSRWMIQGYDLPLWESTQSDTILWARVTAAAKKGDPILTITWTPHWIFAAVDMTILEDVDPPRPEVIDWDKDPFPVKTGWVTASVYKVIRSELKDTAPDVYRLVQNMSFTEDEINKLMLRVDEEGEEMADVARDWINQNQNKIDQWLGKLK